MSPADGAESVSWRADGGGTAGAGTGALELQTGEEARLASLHRYAILDTPPEAGFDDIAGLAAAVCETSTALISFVSFDRQWFKARVGFPHAQTPLDSSVCAHVVSGGDLLVIPDLSQDDRTCANPLVTGPPHIRFYAGAPLVARDGQVLGSLCVIDGDARPQGLTPLQIQALRVLAGQVMSQLELRRLNAMGREALLEELGTARLRERFIAVLGHDLRNPLAALSSGVRLLQRNPDKARADQIAGMMHASVTRMGGLIENVMDFARGRLGGGIAVELAPADLGSAIRHVAEETRAAFPGAPIEVRLDLPSAVTCDAPRLAQMVSNLLANACTHGDPACDIVIEARSGDGVLEVSVVNGGSPIPADRLESLFTPFARGEDSAPRQGLGLGLYIASEIARAHTGELTAASDDEGTRFTFRMPLRPCAMS